jgi:hypothetical protein
VYVAIRCNRIALLLTSNVGKGVPVSAAQGQNSCITRSVFVLPKGGGCFQPKENLGPGLGKLSPDTQPNLKYKARGRFAGLLIALHKYSAMWLEGELGAKDNMKIHYN